MFVCIYAYIVACNFSQYMCILLVCICTVPYVYVCMVIVFIILNWIYLDFYAWARIFVFMTWPHPMRFSKNFYYHISMQWFLVSYIRVAVASFIFSIAWQVFGEIVCLLFFIFLYFVILFIMGLCRIVLDTQSSACYTRTLFPY